MQVLLSYLLVMETLLLLFGVGLYQLFNQDAIHEVDRRLKVLAEYMVSDLESIYINPPQKQKKRVGRH
jgi:hypothetical protein